MFYTFESNEIFYSETFKLKVQYFLSNESILRAILFVNYEEISVIIFADIHLFYNFKFEYRIEIITITRPRSISNANYLSIENHIVVGL
jgi:dephospho-CoA kinase